MTSRQKNASVICEGYEHHLPNILSLLLCHMYSYSDLTKSPPLSAASINIPGVRDWAVVIRCGQIKSLHLEDGLASVNLTAMKKLWRIADNVTIAQRVPGLLGGGRVQVDGGRGEDPDGAWQHLVALHLAANNANNGIGHIQ